MKLRGMTMTGTNTYLELTYDQIVNILRDNTVNLSFTKVKDGGVREMKATLKSELIPSEKRPKTEGSETKNESVVKVFDLDLNEWRSFRPDTLLTFVAV